MPDCHPVCRRAQERGFAKMFSFVQAHPTAVIAGAAAALLLLLAMWLLSRRQTRRLEQRLGALSQQLQEQAQREARETAERERQQRDELRADVRGVNDALVRMMGEMARTQQGQLDSFGGQLRAVNRSDEERMERMQRTVGERLEAYEAQMERITQVLDDKLAGNEERIERVRAALEGGLTLIRRENEQKLEQMRQAVDEKLSGSLDRRLGESFRAVSDRLEQVTRELSQMQTLASGVGDLKRVLTHVNVSGTWSEVRLGALLEQMLAPGQYEACARVNPDGDATADYALLMPGGGEGRVYLPIDASFPQEDYRRYLDAADSGDAGVIEAAQSMGAGAFTIVRKVMLPEALPSLLIGFTTAFITILSYGAMSGAIGGGGLGSLAINYGYQRKMYFILYVSVVILVVMVQVFQSLGTHFAVALDRRVTNKRGKSARKAHRGEKAGLQ